MRSVLTILLVCMFILRHVPADSHFIEILTLLGTIRNPSKRADEEIHTPCMARWQHGPLRLCHGHARFGKELFWSPRHSILLGRLW